jgi:hypothetical protein
MVSTLPAGVFVKPPVPQTTLEPQTTLKPSLARQQTLFQTTDVTFTKTFVPPITEPSR